MATQRLPVSGRDDGSWGDILNGFLLQSHNADGTLRSAAVSATGVAVDSAVVHITGAEVVDGTKTFTSSPVVPNPTLASQVASKSYVDNTVSAGAPDASTSVKGIIKLAGDFGGTAALPTVPGLAAKADITTVNTALAGKEPTLSAGMTSQYYRGDKSWQTLDKTAVGLGNVDNTSDVNKPVSTATTTALNSKLTAANNLSDVASAATARTNIGLGTAATISSTAGGDLSGTLPSPTVTKINGVTLPGSAPSTGQVLTATSSSATGWSTPASAPVSSVFTRTGAITAVSGDYTAAQVTNAADKSSASTQTFTGNVSAPAIVASGLTGATATSRYVGATISGAPTTGTFAVGDHAIDQTGYIWICTGAGTPGTWVSVLPSYSSITASRPSRVESGAYVVTSGAGTSISAGPWTLGQVYYAPLDIAATQTFTGLATNVNVVAVGGTTPLIHIGLYTDDGTGSRPTGSPLANTEVTLDPTTSTGDRYVAWGSPQTFNTSRIWIAWMLTSGSALGSNPTMVILQPNQNVGLAGLGNNSHRGWAMGVSSTAATLPVISGLYRQGGTWPIMGLKAQ